MIKRWVIVGCVIGLISCKHDVLEPAPELETRVPILPSEPFDYASNTFPEHFNESFLDFLSFIPADNPITNEGATLGRVLFYDTQLSRDGSVSCASCHQQENAFSDPEVFSEGIDGQLTERNSMALFNLKYNRRFFWDIRENSLEDQVLQPIEHPGEMDLEINSLVERLESVEYYPELFRAAFGDEAVSSDRISKALAQFLRSIRSHDSKYDQFLAGETTLSALEEEGRDLYFSGDIACNHCHLSANFFSGGALHNGLDEQYQDHGLEEVTGNLSDIGKFKTVSIRNIGLTAPYMHDGRFATLDEVIEHYNSGVQSHANLDDRLTVEGTIGGTPLQLNLSDQQKAALKAFLLILDDYSLTTDIRYSDPFE